MARTAASGRHADGTSRCIAKSQISDAIIGPKGLGGGSSGPGDRFLTGSGEPQRHILGPSEPTGTAWNTKHSYGKRGLRRAPAERAIASKFEECRSEEHTSELQSLMRTSYAVFCL